VKLRATVAVKNGGKWLPVGSIIEVDADEARKLIERKQATPLDDGSAVGNAAAADVDPEGVAVEALCTLDGVSKKTAKLLYAAGYASPDALSEAEVAVDDLTEIEGISEKMADRIVDALNETDDD
jgi:helix-hairpin-helix protein